MLRPGDEDPLAGIADGRRVGFERFEQLEVDQVAKPRILAAVRELLGDGVQLCAICQRSASTMTMSGPASPTARRLAPATGVNSSSLVSSGCNFQSQ
ncbi:MAG: hypothetical protein ACR2H2_13625 [Solirubrobacteraceae bacterium]